MTLSMKIIRSQVMIWIKNKTIERDEFIREYKVNGIDQTVWIWHLFCLCARLATK